jgi:hypothetical protein
MPKEVTPVIGLLKGLEGDILREGLKYRSLGSSDSLLAHRTWRNDLEDDHEKKEPKRKFPEGVAVIPGGEGRPLPAHLDRLHGRARQPRRPPPADILLLD